MTDINAKRLHWLHDCSTGQTDAEGYEWGIYRVKWVDGRAVDVKQTMADFSDLDAEMERELNTSNPEGLRTRHLVEGTQHPLVGQS